jgi:hypothetical protein
MVRLIRQPQEEESQTLTLFELAERFQFAVPVPLSVHDRAELLDLVRVVDWTHHPKEDTVTIYGHQSYVRKERKFDIRYYHFTFGAFYWIC